MAHPIELRALRLDPARVQQALDALVQAFRRWLEPIARAIAAAFRRIWPTVQRLTAARRAGLRRMRTNYSRRVRARRRR